LRPCSFWITVFTTAAGERLFRGAARRWPRSPGSAGRVLVAGVLAARRAPFPVVVLAAAGVTALLRLGGVE
jgi:hypothetical protein